MIRKYEFTGETKDWCLTKLHRIMATEDIRGVVRAGDLGGWIEKEENLSHDGKSWVADEAMVWGAATVMDDAQVSDRAQVWDSVEVSGNAQLRDNTTAFQDAVITGNAKLIEHGSAYEQAVISGDVLVRGFGQVQGNAQLDGSLVVDSGYVIKENVESVKLTFSEDCIPVINDLLETDIDYQSTESGKCEATLLLTENQSAALKSYPEIMMNVQDSVSTVSFAPRVESINDQLLSALKLAREELRNPFFTSEVSKSRAETLNKVDAAIDEAEKLVKAAIASPSP